MERLCPHHSLQYPNVSHRISAKWQGHGILQGTRLIHHFDAWSGKTKRSFMSNKWREGKELHTLSLSLSLSVSLSLCASSGQKSLQYNLRFPNKLGEPPKRFVDPVVKHNCNNLRFRPGADFKSSRTSSGLMGSWQESWWGNARVTLLSLLAQA